MSRPALPAGSTPPEELAASAAPANASAAPADASAAPAKDEMPSLATRLSSLERVMGVLDSRVDDQYLRSSREVTRQITERLSLSPAHTVVALAGATGSGKSTIFNALTGLDLSEVGVRRPVTSAPHACVWGPEGAGPLLDWLSIPYDNRTTRESALDAESQAELRGLVLLDLPDHDSTQLAHRLEVDRLVELVDLLVWVLDPQKYADEAVHSRYLRRLSRHAGVTLVVLNQIDHLTRADQEACLTDIRRLLDADGLRGVPLVPISAQRGDGLAELRERITETVSTRNAALRRLAADLDDVAAELTPLRGPEVREDVDRNSAKRLYTSLAEAAGTNAVGEAVERGYKFTASRNLDWPLLHWFSRAKPDPLAPLRENPTRGRRRNTARPAVLHPVQRPQVEEALRHVAEDATQSLPDPWPRLVHQAARSELDGLPDALDRAVASADLGLSRRPGWWWAWRAVQFALVGCLFAGVAWVLGIAIAVVVSGGDAPDLQTLALPVGLLFGGLILGPVLQLLGRGLSVRTAKQARIRAEQAVLEAVTVIARERVLAPLRTELSAYALVRDAMIAFGVPENASAEVGVEPEDARETADGELTAGLGWPTPRATVTEAAPPASAAGLGPMELDRAEWKAAAANQPDPFGPRLPPALPALPSLPPGSTPSVGPADHDLRPSAEQPTPPARPVRPSSLLGRLGPETNRSTAGAFPALPPAPSLFTPPPATAPSPPPAPESAKAADDSVKPALPKRPARPAPPPPPSSAAEPSGPVPPASGPLPRAPRERPLPPAPPPRPAVEADPEALWSRARPSTLRRQPPEPTPTSSDEAAASPAPPAKPERRSLRGLLGGRRKESPDVVERWWAVEDDEETDPFGRPPKADDDRRRVPDQR